jgi:hypothetical protein
MSVRTKHAARRHGDNRDTTGSVLHRRQGRLKSQGPASEFYRKKAEQHLRCSAFWWLGIRRFIFVGLECLSNHGRHRLRGFPEVVRGQVNVALRGHHIRMIEQLLDLEQGGPRLRAQTGKRVPQIMNANPLDTGLVGQHVQALSRIDQVLRGVPAGKHPGTSVNSWQFFQKCFSLIIEHDVVGATILGVRDTPDPALQVHVLPASGQGFIAARAGQQQQLQRSNGHGRARALSFHRLVQPTNLVLAEKALLSIVLLVFLDPCARGLLDHPPFQRQFVELGENAQVTIGRRRAIALLDLAVVALDVAHGDVAKSPVAKLRYQMDLELRAVILCRTLVGFGPRHVIPVGKFLEGRRASNPIAICGRIDSRIDIGPHVQCFPAGILDRQRRVFTDLHRPFLAIEGEAKVEDFSALLVDHEPQAHDFGIGVFGRLGGRICTVYWELINSALREAKLCFGGHGGGLVTDWEKKKPPGNDTGWPQVAQAMRYAR